MGYPEAVYTINEVLKGVNKIGAGESGLIPLPPKGVILPGLQSIRINVSLTDTVVDSQTLCYATSVMIRIKEGQELQSEEDGTLVGYYKKESLSEEIVIPNLENGIWYSVGVWSISEQGVYNTVEPIRKMIQPGVDVIYGFHQDFTDGNPDTCISYIGANMDFEPMYTRVANNPLLYRPSQNGQPSEGTYPGGLPKKSFTLGDWMLWPWLRKNRPFTINPNTGQKVKELDPNDYRRDVNGELLGDADKMNFYAWIPRLYIKEVYDSDQNGRTVYFSETKITSSTSGFVNLGFYDKNGNETKGMWICMTPAANNDWTNPSTFSEFKNYPKINYYNGSYASSGTIPSSEYQFTSQKSNTYDVKTLNSTFYSNANSRPRLGFYGGALHNLLRDVLFMLYKTTDIQKNAGYGNSATYLNDVLIGNEGVSFSSYKTVSTTFSSSDKILYGNPKETAEDLFFKHGGFYVMDSYSAKTYYNSSYTSTMGTEVDGGGKLFHCFSLGSYMCPIIDPNIAIVGTQLRYATRYKYSDEDYISSSLTLSETSAFYPKKMIKISDSFGSYPTGSGASSSTYLCDWQDFQKKTTIYNVAGYSELSGIGSAQNYSVFIFKSYSNSSASNYNSGFSAVYGKFPYGANVTATKTDGSSPLSSIGVNFLTPFTIYAYWLPLCIPDPNYNPISD